ncbi:MAG: nitroreductase family protein [Brevinema sp.]
MNEFIQVMQNRRSVRSYDTSKQIPAEVLNEILLAGRQSPTSIGAQQYSIIVVDDEQTKQKMVELTMPSSGKPMSYIKDASVFLLFVMDFHKVNEVLKSQGQEMHIHESMEALMVGSVDVGIACEAVSAAAESLGLSTVMIGAVRRDPAAIIEQFNLPKYTFPILGLCVGYASEDAPTAINPRLPLETLVHHGAYSLPNLDGILKEYNQITEARYLARGMKDLNWSKFVSNFYNKRIFPDLVSVYKSQGFDLN